MAPSPTPDGNDHKWTVRERPWLVPWNRRLRHLQGIALRNLTLADENYQLTKTADDQALPNSLTSPAKLLALQEIRQLGHSRSSNDLRPIHESALSDQDTSTPKLNGAIRGGGKVGKTRPRLAKLRRRSTMEWAGASSRQRQKKLEDLSASRLADVFFSLHVRGVEDAVYVSETIHKTMNADFRHVDFEGCGPGVTRAESVRVKIWVKSDRMDKHSLLLDMSLNLRSLQFIGKELASFSHPFPPNAVIFQLTDGYYTCFTDAQVDQPSNPFTYPPIKTANSRTLRTSTFDALLRLSKLDDSIQDALDFRDKLTTDLEKIVGGNHQSLADRNNLAERQDFVQTVNYAKTRVEKQLSTLRERKEAKHIALRARRDLLHRSKALQRKDQDEMTSGHQALEKKRSNIEHLKTSISQQRRRVCEDVQKIYPIDPLSNQALSFTIRGLHLPNSEELDTTPTDTVSGALGHVTQTLQLLSFYLHQPLPYPVHPRSSTSTITDPISLLKPTATNTTQSTQTNKPSSSAPLPQPTLKDANRTYPLSPRHAGPRYRFEYALFLLNKDIEILLSNTFRVRVLDIRQTLPNLLYAIYCATAGEGELPARKAGGVRGLLRAGGNVLGGGKSQKDVEGRDRALSELDTNGNG